MVPLRDFAEASGSIDMRVFLNCSRLARWAATWISGDSHLSVRSIDHVAPHPIQQAIYDNIAAGANGGGEPHRIRARKCSDPDSQNAGSCFHRGVDRIAPVAQELLRRVRRIEPRQEISLGRAENGAQIDLFREIVDHRLTIDIVSDDKKILIRVEAGQGSKTRRRQGIRCPGAIRLRRGRQNAFRK